MARLQDITTLVTDGKHGDCQNEANSGFYFVSCKDVRDGWIEYSSARQITRADYAATHKRTQLAPNDIVITNSGTIGRMALVRDLPETRRTTFQKSVAIVKPDQEKAVPQWLYYSLLANRDALIAWAGGTAQKNLLLRDMRAFEVDVPPVLVQEKIAAILSAYDDLIENNLRRIKILEEMAQNLYREWFVKFRFPGHEKVRMVDSPLGKIPEGWEVVPMEDVCARITDGAHRSPKSAESGFPMASVKDMHDWGINISTCRTISEEEFRNLERNDCKMRKDDVLIAKDGSYLKHCFVVEKDLDIALLSSIAMLRPNKRIRPHVLAMTLLEPDVKTRMKGYVSGAALPRIILKEFRKFQIVLAPRKTQEEWAAIAEPMIEMCWRLIEKNNNLHQTRDLLLPKLISGELDVSELDIDIGQEAA